jgi:EAL domain-containing protein (putative c-di-GMP-specific phosphodiesterase class I)
VASLMGHGADSGPSGGFVNSDRSGMPKLGTELWTAIGGGGIDVCYQPKVEMATGIVRGAEALVRWYHPRLGRVRPSKLVRVAERTGAIRPLTMWVMQHALAECRSWRDAGWDLSVAVNLSARNLVDRRLADDVARLLDEAGVPSPSLTLEITETMVVGESQRSLDVVQSLVDLGVKISCDDFGTGYASLSRLRRLPIDEIKVDRSFVLRLAEDETDRAITRSVLQLGRGLGLNTVAEGVEDREGWDILRAFGCDQAQGFLVSRPLAADRFREWMTRQPESARPKMAGAPGLVAAPSATLDPGNGPPTTPDPGRGAGSGSGGVTSAPAATASASAPPASMPAPAGSTAASAPAQAPAQPLPVTGGEGIAAHLGQARSSSGG